MDLRNITLDYTAKALLRELAKLAGCQYVCVDIHKKKPCVIFSVGDYSTGFSEIICYREDLTLDNLKLMIEYGVTR